MTTVNDPLVVAPLLVALGTAIASLLARFDLRVERAVSLVGAVGYTAATLLLFERVVVDGSGVLPYYLSNWPAPYGITLVADALSASLLGLAGVVTLPALVFAVVNVDEFGQRLSFHPLYHFMVAGVSGAFLTGDVFNLFVWFEVMLMSSYVLVTFYSGPKHTRAALTYVVLNLLGSAVMLVAIGGLYATTGTLNMAAMARRLAEPAAYDVAVAPTLGLAALLLAVFALKAGIVPFHFWVPAAYDAAPAPVTAVLAGAVKKVGVYAVIRLFFTVFAAAEYAGGTALDYVGPVLLATGAASAVYGGLAAVGRDRVEELLAFSSVAQIGFVVVPLGVAALAPAAAVPETVPGETLAAFGVAAALVYSFNHAVAKGLLFLVAGTLADAVGSTRFADLGGLARRTPVLATAFLLGGLSLIGVPPLIGFFGKLLVFRVSVVAGAVGAGTAATLAWLGLAATLLGAVFTIAYVTRAWNAVFWGEPSTLVETAVPERWAAGRREPTATAADGGESAGATAEAAGAAGDDHAGADADAGGSVATASRTTLAVETVVVATLAVSLVGLGLGADVIVDAAAAAGEAATDTTGYVEAVVPEGGVDGVPADETAAADGGDG
ncbi:complex I subunit 5 family protein [Halobaculum sp. MBLA0147]|uniref:complex I subunit 5 family protein n=1 Tax=Halobaculum sp. MBLA0147 TaxID=3079934 RepID=UPI003523A490